MNYFRIILGMVIISIVGIAGLVFWHKKIDRETTWIYAVYVILNIILSLFVLIGFEQFWLVHG